MFPNKVIFVVRDGKFKIINGFLKLWDRYKSDIIWELSDDGVVVITKSKYEQVPKEFSDRVEKLKLLL